MRIYSRKGDGGETGLMGPGRYSKSEAVFEALGDLDELNCQIGVVLSGGVEAQLADILRKAQNLLFEIGSELAVVEGSAAMPARLDGSVEELERSMDALEASMSPLTNFVLPGGTPTAASLHVARAVCRRAERSVVRYAANVPQRPEPLRYVNRLSDWLFTAARYANARANVEDVVWRKEN